MPILENIHALFGPNTSLQYGDIKTLRLFFENAYKPPENWKIGMEYEISGLYEKDLSPMTFFGQRSIEAIFAELRKKYGEESGSWEDGYCFGITTPYGSLSLEPGGQLELSSRPAQTIADGKSMLCAFLHELQDIAQKFDIGFYSAGVDPFHPIEAMPWSHKPRYKIMRSYLAQRGTLAHYMMQQTMSIQFNIDYASESDAVRKYQTARHLQPILLFLSSNSQIYNKTILDHSFRQEIWANTDADRCGLPPSIQSFDDYIEYALDVPMFSIKRDELIIPIANGLTFRRFLQSGFQTYRATYGDWEIHLSTLFPEVRFKKNALELRMFDGNAPAIACALCALVKGIFYSDQQIDRVLQQDWGTDWQAAEQLIQLAHAGLIPEEQDVLLPLSQMIEQQQLPAQKSIAVFTQSQRDPRALFEHLRINL
jgi:glutamate--cysteine ligase